MKDFLFGALFAVAFVLALGVLSWWFQWDTDDREEIDYRIQRAPIVQPKYIKV